MKNEILTIVTPTYNRREKLTDLYQSLLSQTNHGFVWLIIDDGSTDNTNLLAESFSKENRLSLEYHFKKNGGKHTALNYAFSKVETPLLLIVDSDDTLLPDAVETILDDYEKYKNDSDIGLYVYRKIDTKDECSSPTFFNDHFIADGIKHFINSPIYEKAEVIVTNSIRTFQFPEYEGEKFAAETILWIPLMRQYRCLVRNVPIYTFEYCDDGLTKAGRKLRIQNPLGGMHNSLLYIYKDINLKLQIKNTLLYIAYEFFSKGKNHNYYLTFPRKTLYYSLFIPGFLLYQYWKKKYL